jgi:phosphate transport system substrate-binding protein
MDNQPFRSRLLMGVICLQMMLVAACSENGSSEADQGSGLNGVVRLDGSSTVFPISEAAAEEFRLIAPDVRVTVGVSGTGGGFEKFLAGETDINAASRAIRDPEIAVATEEGMQYIGLPVAYDGLSIVVNPLNTWVDYLTVEELNLIWEPGSLVDSWNDIRPEWPDRPVHLYGPGTDSGTFDYFTDAINGATGASRADFTASEDDNVLVQGIIGDPDALGFFGFAYYTANIGKVKLVPVDSGSGPVYPSTETIKDKSYYPLTRPLFIYLNSASARLPQVRAFVEFYLDNASQLVEEVGYVPLPPEEYNATKAAFAAFH